MHGEPPVNLESLVVTVLRGAFRSREVIEADLPEEMRPLDEGRLALHRWSSMIHRQGTLLAYLSVVPATRAELLKRMPGMLDRAPAWLDAYVRGDEPMTVKLFARGVAQTLAVQREAFEQVIDDQVVDPEPIERSFAEAPVPAGTEDEGQSELISAVGDASNAHMAALADIAYDLETHLHRLLGDPDEE